MCMGSPQMPAYKPPEPPVYEKGPASPDDMVNEQKVDNVNDRSQQDAMRDRNKGAQTTSQSGSKTDKAY